MNLYSRFDNRYSILVCGCSRVDKNYPPHSMAEIDPNSNLFVRHAPTYLSFCVRLVREQSVDELEPKLLSL